MIDQFTVSLVTAVVVVTSAVIFVVETLLRRDLAAGRLWAIGYMCGIVTTLFYVVWAWDPTQFWATAGGNAAFVGTTGFLWLGCRRFNDRPTGWAWTVVAVGVACTGGAALLEGPEGGDWAGALWMFVALAILAALAAAECLRGALGELGTALALCVVFSLQSLYYIGRSVVFATAGPESELFLTWFDARVTGFLTVILTITAVVATSVLRAGRASLRGPAAARATSRQPLFAVHSASVFDDAWRRVCAQAAHRGETAAILIVRVDELDDIAAAFGADARDRLVEVWRRCVLDHAPTLAIVGEDRRGALAVGCTVRTPSEARRVGADIHRALFDAFGEVSGGAMPAIGVGIATGNGDEPDDLRARATAAAARAASSVASAVLVAD